jgi:hypothetical protein
MLATARLFSGGTHPLAIERCSAAAGLATTGRRTEPVVPPLSVALTLPTRREFRLGKKYWRRKFAPH